MFYSVLYRVKQNEAIYILSFIYMAKAYLKLSGFKIKNIADIVYPLLTGWGAWSHCPVSWNVPGTLNAV